MWPVVLLQHQALKPAGPSTTLRVGGSERLRLGLTQALLQASVQAACALVGALPASSLAFRRMSQLNTGETEQSSLDAFCSESRTKMSVLGPQQVPPDPACWL